MTERNEREESLKCENAELKQRIRHLESENEQLRDKAKQAENLEQYINGVFDALGEIKAIFGGVER